MDYWLRLCVDVDPTGKPVGCSAELHKGHSEKSRVGIIVGAPWLGNSMEWHLEHAMDLAHEAWPQQLTLF